MFFIMSILPGRKDLDFHQMTECGICGAYGNLTVFYTYTTLALFFIPILKWGKRYFVTASCCGSVFELNPEVGKRISKGESVTIQRMDMTPLMQGRARKSCRYCGFTTEEDFQYCPKCGQVM